MDYSIRGIAAGVASGVNTLTKPFRTPDGYTPASATPAPAPAPAATPAPVAPQLGGVNLDAMKRREAAAGMKHGGVVKGPGTGTSDSIPRDVPVGSYIMPADSTKTLSKRPSAIRKMADGGMVPLRLSNGENEIPPDVVHKIGVKVLNIVKNATHQKAQPKAGAIRKMANGGMVRRGYADGGTVDDERRQRLIDQIPPTTATPGPTPTERDTSTELGRNVSNTISALPGVAPMLGAIRGLSAASSALPSAAGIVGKLASLAAPVAPYAPVAGGAVLLNAGATPAATPAPAPAVSAPAAAPAAAPVPAATDATPQPGAITRIDTGSSPLFTNVSGVDNSALMARGQPSAQNVAAADAMSARYNPAPTEAPITGNGVTVLADTGGYGLRDKATLAARNASVGGDIRGLSAREMARQANARDIAAEQNATSRANNQDTNATSIANTQTNAANAKGRLALDTQTHSQDSTLKAGQIKLQQQTEAARADWLNAKTPEAQVAAEEKLRVLQGKAEKTVPDLYSATTINGGVDPATGMPVGAGVVITNKRDGTFKVVSPQEAKGQGAAPKFETGKVYQDAKGNKAKWDGAKFVPA